MTHHIFDANTLRNLALADMLQYVPDIVEGICCMGSVVRQELRRGASVYPKRHQHRLADPNWRQYITRFQQLDAELKRLGFQERAVSSASRRAGEFAFLSCLTEEDVMEAGEAEAFTLAVYRDMTLYSDERKVYYEGQAFNAADFPCPYAGDTPPEYDVTVHSTAWLLLEGVRKGVFDMARAEAAYLEMRTFWQRHPNKTLAQLQAGDGMYW